VDATDIESAKTEAGKLRRRIAAGETIHGKQGPTFSEYREHYIKTALKKPKTLYNENYFLKAWQKFLGKDIKIGSITKQNVLACSDVVHGLSLVRAAYSAENATNSAASEFSSAHKAMKPFGLGKAVGFVAERINFFVQIYNLATHTPK